MKGRQDWRTPDDLFRRLDAKCGPFDLGAAASAENAKCARFFTEQDDGLAQPWAPARVWCNPPYTPEMLRRFVEKAYQESRRGALVVLLIPNRSEQGWYQDIVLPHAEVRPLRGRVRFVLPDRSSSSPFPSAVVIFRPPAAEQQGAA